MLRRPTLPPSFRRTTPFDCYGDAPDSAGTTMIRTKAAVSGVTVVIGLAAIAIALPRAQAGAPAKPAAAARQGVAPDQGGRSGGRDANPTAALFLEQCSGCHGTDLAGGRAP